MVIFAVRSGHLEIDRAFALSLVKFVIAGSILAGALWLASRQIAFALQGIALRDELTLLSLIVIGAAVYAALILALFGRRWIVALIRR